MKKACFAVLLLVVLSCLFGCSVAQGDTDNSDSYEQCDHSFGEWTQIKAPNCAEEGLEERYCSCGEKETQFIGITDHKAVADECVDPTCTETGLTEGAHCSVCNKVLVSQSTIDAQGHNYSLSRDLTASGIYALFCTRCRERKDMQTVKYSDYGAVGDGVTDDSVAIRRAHDAANYYGLDVEGTPGAVYYIGPLSTTINVKTNTDWKGATFIFGDDGIYWDDSTLRSVNVFTVQPDTKAKSISVPEGLTLSKGQTNIGMTFDAPCLLRIENSSEKIYMRYGVNSNSGVDKKEMILVDENGNVDPSTTIQYDYSSVSKITVYSVGDDPIFVGNGKIITRAPNPKDQDPSYENNYCYYNRGIYVHRSNTTLYGIEHIVDGEDMTVETDRNGDGVIDKWGADKSYGVPYSGFFTFKVCYNVVMTDCTVEGHQAYSFYQNGISRNEMGSYDINATDMVKVSFVNIRQYENAATGELITNRFMYHGVMQSNFTRNITLDNCYFDRFDSHQGLYNATIKNSTIGFGILAVGGGVLHIENVHRISGNDGFVLLRHDYNSVFAGDVIIKNCTMGSGITHVIDGAWNEFYNGLDNYMTTSLNVDGLTVGTKTVYLYKIRGAVSGSVLNEVNKLYLPTIVKAHGVVQNDGKPAYVVASMYDDVFAGVPLETDKIEHNWDDGSVITPASVTDCSSGIIRYTCKDCGAIENCVLASSVPHSYLSQRVEDGSIVYECSACGTALRTDGYLLLGEGYDGIEGVGNAENFTTVSGTQLPIINENGEYELIKKTDDSTSQMQLWIPAMKTSDSTISSESGDTGYLSFKINAYASSGLFMQLVDTVSNVGADR